MRFTPKSSIGTWNQFTKNRGDVVGTIDEFGSVELEVYPLATRDFISGQLDGDTLTRIYQIRDGNNTYVDELLLVGRLGWRDTILVAELN